MDATALLPLLSLALTPVLKAIAGFVAIQAGRALHSLQTHIRNKTAQAIVEQEVAAAKQQFGKLLDNEALKRMVVANVEKRLPWLPSEVADSMIEASVLALKDVLSLSPIALATTVGVPVPAPGETVAAVVTSGTTGGQP